MPSSQSILSVANLSLLSIGNRTQISNLNEGSTQANAVNTLYSFVYEQLARTARWGCLKKQTTLTLLQAAQGTAENPTGSSLPIPQQPWLFAYLYPSDALFVRAVLCPVGTNLGSGTPQTPLANSVTPWIPGNSQIPYEIGYSQDAFGNPITVILTNQQNAVANYTVDQPNPSSWDSLFTSAYVASLAAYLVPALSLNMALMQAQIAIADRLILQARAMDANENPISQDHYPDWMRARQGSSGFGVGLPGYNGYGFISMSWPTVY